jgi:hypothetical protein
MNKIIIETDRFKNKFWTLDNKLHGVDGPAVEYTDGHKEWWLDGKLHRIDGPAVEYADGRKYWYLSGVKIQEKDFVINKKGQ